MSTDVSNHDGVEDVTIDETVDPEEFGKLFDSTDERDAWVAMREAEHLAEQQDDQEANTLIARSNRPRMGYPDTDNMVVPRPKWINIPDIGDADFPFTWR